TPSIAPPLHATGSVCRWRLRVRRASGALHSPLSDEHRQSREDVVDYGVRRKNAKGRWTNALDIAVEPPMRPDRTGDRAADAQTFVEQVNARIESWVRADPDQWLWIHRRWGRWAD
ncbi:MAG: hypothetical protein AAF684_07175, partial [Pseudomonadota bacterium]